MISLMILLVAESSAGPPVPEPARGRYAEQAFVQGLLSRPVVGTAGEGLRLEQDTIVITYAMEAVELRIVDTESVDGGLRLRLQGPPGTPEGVATLHAGPPARLSLDDTTWVRTSDALPALPEHVPLEHLATLSLLSKGFREGDEAWVFYPSIDFRKGALTSDGRRLAGGFGFNDAFLIDTVEYGFERDGDAVVLWQTGPADGPDLEPLEGGDRKRWEPLPAPPFRVVPDTLALRQHPDPSSEPVGRTSSERWVGLWARHRDHVLLHDGEQLGWAPVSAVRVRSNPVDLASALVPLHGTPAAEARSQDAPEATPEHATEVNSEHATEATGERARDSGCLCASVGPAGLGLWILGLMVARRRAARPS